MGVERVVGMSAVITENLDDLEGEGMQHRHSSSRLPV